MEIEYKENNKITADEIIKVFKSVGWEKQHDNIIAAFKNSYYVTAYHSGKIIGFARAISDYFYYTNIHDVVVIPSYQRKGIARKMIDMILKKFKGNYFFLTYTEGNKLFYQRCGFIDNHSSMWIPKPKK